MKTTILPNKVSCLNCIHYEYVDSKQSNNGFWHWGYCHYQIPRMLNDEESIEDLSEYFQVTESHFCGYFQLKDNK